MGAHLKRIIESRTQTHRRLHKLTKPTKLLAKLCAAPRLQEHKFRHDVVCISVCVCVSEYYHSGGYKIQMRKLLVRELLRA